MADWTAIKTEYITTEASYRDLAQKYGVSRNQLGKVGKEEGWVELRRQHRDNKVSKTVAAVEAAEANRARKMQTVANKLLNKIDALVDRCDLLSDKTIRSLAAALKDLKDVQGVKSDRDAREQEARIRKLEKEARAEEKQAASTVTVVFEGTDVEDWSG